MERLIDFFKVLSDETRLRILVLLAQDNCCVCELQGVLAISQPKTSKHLSKLRDMGYVDVERKDKFMEYRLNVTDPMQRLVIENIVKNIHTYPKLEEDRLRLSHKEQFICKL